MSEEEFVTVVSVEDAPFVTVVEVEEPHTGISRAEETSPEPPVEEEIQLYRLPGERLGFGLKFDGGPTVIGLTIESTAEGSPSARARASWGPLGPGDSILAVDGQPVAGMTRQEVVGRLTESGLVVRLLVRRGPPPVPPRRQTRRRLPGPPPPPRPLPRAPPRLVDFLPKDNNSRSGNTHIEDSTIPKCTMTENLHKIEINGGQGIISKREDIESNGVPLNFEENLKEKISPLKNLNPKLISLFEHSQPSDTNTKTSQINNNLWKNDDKSRKSVKDKIALFSNESNNCDNRVKQQENGEFIRNENYEKKIPKKVQTLQAKVNSKPESNNNYLCSKINISKDSDDKKNISDQNIIKIDMSNDKHLSNDHNVLIELSNTASRSDALTSELNQTQNDSSFSSRMEKNTKIPNEAQGKSDVSKYCFLNNYTDNKKKPSIIKEKNTTKLRGLVIPQNLTRVSAADQILDLPEIKSTNLFPNVINTEEVKVNHSCDQNIFSKQKPPPPLNPNLNTYPPNFDWKPRIDHEIPKYSPAFKRKALSVFEIRNQFPTSHSGGTCTDTTRDKSISSYKNSEKEHDVTECEKLLNTKSFETPASLSQESEDKASNLHSLELEESITISGLKNVHPSLNTEDDESKSDSNTLSCFSNSTENHSKSSSVTSETAVSQSSEYSSNIDLEKIKEPLEGKLDSLQSQDMSDSGNHSIPSNCSKSKYDSCDESMCSLVNGEMQDSDDTSLNSSSDEGQFIEFNYKNNNAFNSRKNDLDALIGNDKPQELFSDTVNIDYEIKSKCPDSTTCTSAKCDASSELNQKRKDNSTTTDTIDITAKQISNIKCSESQKEPSHKTIEDKERTDEGSVFKISHANKFSKPRNRDIKNNNDYGFALLSRDYNEDNICILNSPISDLQKDNHFASITSLASSTSLISQQELCQLIEESNDSSMEDSNGSPEISVIVLHRDTAEGSIGIILAGGVDYESKDITVHKVLMGSSADRDGRIKKGHRILSINGKSMKGLTHAESLAVLKAPRHEVVLVVARSQGELFEENNNISQSTLPTTDSDLLPVAHHLAGDEVKWGPVISITLKKEGAGLGFSLRGGKDSPSGDQPLTVQKIFTGGCADKSKQLFAGDELISINDFDLNGMTRVEAWTLMKRLPDGEILLKIRHPAQ